MNVRNVRWSTGPAVPKALGRPSRLVPGVPSRPSNLSKSDGMQFNIIRRLRPGEMVAEIDSFIESLKDASYGYLCRVQTWLLAHLDRFQEELRQEDVEAIPAEICNSVTVSTMRLPAGKSNGLPAVLLKEKHLNTSSSMQPDLTGHDPSDASWMTWAASALEPMTAISRRIYSTVMPPMLKGLQEAQVKRGRKACCSSN